MTEKTVRVFVCEVGFSPAAARPVADKTASFKPHRRCAGGGSAIKARLPGGVSELPGGDAVNH